MNMIWLISLEGFKSLLEAEDLKIEKTQEKGSKGMIFSRNIKNIVII